MSRPVRRRTRAIRAFLGRLFAGIDLVPVLRRRQPRVGGRLVSRCRLRRPLRTGRRDRARPPESIAHAAYLRIDARRAEVAFLVADDYQGNGISTIMLAHLAGRSPPRNGIATFIADVLPANHRMIEVFRQSGFPVELRSSPEVIKIEFPTSMTAEAIARFDERDRIAAVAAVRRVLEPRSVAVIGASRRRGTVGGEILHNLLAADFSGAVYAVNPARRAVQGLDAYGSVAEHARAGRPRRRWRFPPQRVLGVARTAPRRACTPCGDLRRVRRGWRRRGRAPARAARRSAATPGCGWSAPTASACSTPLPTSGSTRPSRRIAHRPGAIGFMSQSGGLGIAIIEAAAAGNRTVVVRLGRQQGRPVRQRHAAATGSRIPAPRSRCSTSSRSATHASSRGSRRRFARSQAGDGGQERTLGGRCHARPRPTPARSCRPPM